MTAGTWVEPMRADFHEIARVAVDEHGASQLADELADALAVVAGLNPSVIVEIGCDAGGTLWAWRQICRRVYGITLADNSHATGGGDRPLDAHGATVHIGDSHDPASRDWLVDRIRADRAPLGQPVDALVIDGDHSYDGVRNDFAMYAPLVRPGGLVLLHDIAVVNDPRAQVHRFWPELTGRYRTSEILSTRQQPYGWGVVHL